MVGDFNNHLESGPFGGGRGITRFRRDAADPTMQTNRAEKSKITTSRNTIRSEKRRRRIAISNHRNSNRRMKAPSIGHKIGRLAKNEKNGYPHRPKIGRGGDYKWLAKCILL